MLLVTKRKKKEDSYDRNFWQTYNAVRWILRSNFSHKREDHPKLGSPHASSCLDQYKQGSRICNPCLQLHRCDPIISSSFYILPLCECKRNSWFLTISVRSHWIILVHITFTITHHHPISIYLSIYMYTGIERLHHG